MYHVMDDSLYIILVYISLVWSRQALLILLILEDLSISLALHSIGIQHNLTVVGSYVLTITTIMIMIQIYIYLWPHFESMRIEWTAHVVALAVVILYDLCAHGIHDRRN